MKAEIAKNKELDAARKEIDAERHILNTLITEIKDLERQLRRKDKALAEAAALLILQKKVRELWGDEDDDTDEGNGK